MDTKRTIAALAAAALAGSLIAGCSSGGSGAEEGKTKLTVWAMGDSSKPMEQMAAAYQKENPDVSIQVQAIPWGSAHDKLLTAVASKKVRTCFRWARRGCRSSRRPARWPT